MSSSFQSIPLLDFSLSLSVATKPEFLRQLRHALLDVGFLYIKNTGINEELIQRVIDLGKAFFELAEEEKMRLEMKNCRYHLEGCSVATGVLSSICNRFICTMQLPISSATPASVMKCKAVFLQEFVLSTGSLVVTLNFQSSI